VAFRVLPLPRRASQHGHCTWLQGERCHVGVPGPSHASEGIRPLLVLQNPHWQGKGWSSAPERAPAHPRRRTEHAHLPCFVSASLVPRSHACATIRPPSRHSQLPDLSPQPPAGTSRAHHAVSCITRRRTPHHPAPCARISPLTGRWPRGRDDEGGGVAHLALSGSFMVPFSGSSFLGGGGDAPLKEM